jgi:hypothetical protein
VENGRKNKYGKVYFFERGTHFAGCGEKKIKK